MSDIHLTLKFTQTNLHLLMILDSGLNAKQKRFGVMLSMIW